VGLQGFFEQGLKEIRENIAESQVKKKKTESGIKSASYVRLFGVSTKVWCPAHLPSI